MQGGHALELEGLRFIGPRGISPKPRKVLQFEQLNSPSFSLPPTYTKLRNASPASKPNGEPGAVHRNFP